MADGVSRRRLWALIGIVSISVPVPLSLGAQALPFHTGTAITTGFEEQALRTFAAFGGRSGLVRDGRSIPDPMERDVDVFMGPVALLPYAITAQWTTRVVLPIVRMTMDFTGPDGIRRRYATTGVGDPLVDTKWVFLVRNRPRGTTRLGVEGGVKLPVGGTDARLPDGSRAPRPLQVGTGSWDVPVKALFTTIRNRFGVHADVGYRFNGAASGFEAGDVATYDVALAFRFAPGTYRSFTDRSAVAYLEFNGASARRNAVEGRPDPDSGGNLLFVSPGLQWIPTPWFLLEASVQVPILQDLHGTQLGYDTRFQWGARYRFSL